MEKSAKRFLICSLFCLYSFGASFESNADNLPRLVKKVQPAVVTIKVFDSNKKLVSTGTGFFIGKEGTLVTNFHVLKNAHSAIALTSDGMEYSISTVLSADKSSDIVKAVVNIPKGGIHALEVSESLPEAGEHIVVIGSPLGLSQSVTDGIVSYVPERQVCGVKLSASNCIQLSAPISPGSSGSPVVNMDGEVIGVATFMNVRGQNLNFAVPSGCIHSLTEMRMRLSINDWSGSNESVDLEKAETFLKRDQPELAIDAFIEVLKEHPRSAKAYYGLGRSYNSMYIRKNTDKNSKQWVEKSVMALNKALLLNPDFAEAYCELGSTYSMISRPIDAIPHLKTAIDLKPNYAEAHNYLGAVYAHIRKFEWAREQLKILEDMEYEYAPALKFTIDYFENANRQRQKKLPKSGTSKESNRSDGAIKIHKNKEGVIVISN